METLDNEVAIQMCQLPYGLLTILLLALRYRKLPYRQAIFGLLEPSGACHGSTRQLDTDPRWQFGSYPAVGCYDDLILEHIIGVSSESRKV